MVVTAWLCAWMDVSGGLCGLGFGAWFCVFVLVIGGFGYGWTLWLFCLVFWCWLFGVCFLLFCGWVGCKCGCGIVIVDLGSWGLGCFGVL